jgi:hypothetical protein
MVGSRIAQKSKKTGVPVPGLVSLEMVARACSVPNGLIAVSRIELPAQPFSSFGAFETIRKGSISARLRVDLPAGAAYDGR